MVELFALSAKTGFDIPKTLAMGKLSKCHDQVLIEAPESLHIPFALMALNTSAETAHWQVIGDL